MKLADASRVALGAAVLVAACGHNRGHENGGAAGTAPETYANTPGAPAGIHLIAELPRGEWRMPTGDYGALRFSPLDQITTQNVRNLHPYTTLATGVARGHEGQPLIVNNTMYVVTPFPNNLIAVDLTKPGGSIKFVYEPHPDRRAMGIACCDVVNRGAAYADGKIIYSLLDAHVVAVDANDGHEVWRTKVGDINYGETFTAAPLVVKNEVIVGNSGGEL